jgi:hypothetical protein
MASVEAIERVGPLRVPRNTYQGSQSSIHNDATASKLGFKGGTVAGSIHMDQFAPLLLDLYGEAWLERGNMSLMFQQATVDGEPVQASLTRDGERARLSMRNEKGDLICEGTAGLGRDDTSELALRLKAQAPAGELRILAAIKPGDEAKDIPLEATTEALERRLETITEHLPAYDEGVLPPSMVVHLAHGARAAVVASAGKAVGLFGALEIEVSKGPLKAGVPYVGRTKVLAMADSPRTEAVWYDVFVDDQAGENLARVRFFLRFMKGSSPLWTA